MTFTEEIEGGRFDAVLGFDGVAPDLMDTVLGEGVAFLGRDVDWLAVTRVLLGVLLTPC